MLSFENDYSRAAHPAVLEAVAEANNHLYSGYGSDELSDQAKAKIREACGQPDAGCVVPRRRHADQPGRHRHHHPGVCRRGRGRLRPSERARGRRHRVLRAQGAPRFPSTTAKWTRPNWTSSARPSMRTATTSTWCSRAPCTSRKAPNTAPSTPRPSCRPSPTWRTRTTCRCSWTARDSATR